MSNRSTRIADKLRKLEIEHEFILSTTLMGSIVSTVSMFAHKDSKAAWREFSKLRRKKNLPSTVREIMEWICDDYKMTTEERASLWALAVLVTDPENKLTPMVSWIMNEQVMPISTAGLPLGIIGRVNKEPDKYQVEYVFEEEE